MIDFFLTKENWALIGVIILFAWKIVDLFIRRAERKSYKLDELAFKMAKEKISENRTYGDNPILSYFSLCRNFLERKKKYSKDFFDWIKHLEHRIVARIDELNNLIKQLESKIEKAKEGGRVVLLKTVPTWKSVFFDFMGLLIGSRKREIRKIVEEEEESHTEEARKQEAVEKIIREEREAEQRKRGETE